MSVLIKGLDMPKDYIDIRVFANGTVKSYTHNGLDVKTQINAAIEVPTPHGRLVDISKLDKDKMESDNPVMCMTVNGVYIEAVSLDYLDGLPTVIEAEAEE